MERMSLDERAKIFMADFRSGMTLREIRRSMGRTISNMYPWC